jgi:hypothetical protein
MADGKFVVEPVTSAIKSRATRNAPGFSPQICMSIGRGHPCAYRKSNSGILMMQSTEDRPADNLSGGVDGA